MRFIVLILAVFTLTQSHLAHSDTRFLGGAGFNFNLPYAKGELNNNVDEKISETIALAGEVEVDLNEKWILRTGLWLQQKSAFFKSKDKDNKSLIINTSYLSLPLTALYRTSQDVGVYAGYVADLRLNDYCRVKDNKHCWLKENTKGIVNIATIGVIIWGKNNFQVDLGWQQALTDTMKDAYRTHTFQAMLFYKF